MVSQDVKIFISFISFLKNLFARWQSGRKCVCVFVLFGSYFDFHARFQIRELELLLLSSSDIQWIQLNFLFYTVRIESDLNFFLAGRARGSVIHFENKAMYKAIEFKAVYVFLKHCCRIIRGKNSVYFDIHIVGGTYLVPYVCASNISFDYIKFMLLWTTDSE